METIYIAFIQYRNEKCKKTCQFFNQSRVTLSNLQIIESGIRYLVPRHYSFVKFKSNFINITIALLSGYITRRYETPKFFKTKFNLFNLISFKTYTLTLSLLQTIIFFNCKGLVYCTASSFVENLLPFKRCCFFHCNVILKPLK